MELSVTSHELARARAKSYLSTRNTTEPSRALLAGSMNGTGHNRCRSLETVVMLIIIKFG
jgi:hypothetical protein